MYKYSPPIPIVVNLNTDEGFDIRQEAVDFVVKTRARGAESGSIKQQGFGAIAEIYVSESLGFKKEDNESLGYDFVLPSGVKVDVKCRGGKLTFQEIYTTEDGTSRETKHNFFVRQLYDERLDADMYIMAHLKAPGEIPGSARSRTSWMLYICGWVSKKRVIRDGIFLPRGSLTERLRDWFSYKADEIEFFNKHLNGIEDLRDILVIEQIDIEKDAGKKSGLNMTSVDALRLSYDLVGRGVLKRSHIGKIKSKLGMIAADRTTFHPNQYFHLLRWLYEQGLVTKGAIQKLKSLMKEINYKNLQLK